MGRVNPVIAGEMDSWSGYQGSEVGNEIQRFEDDVGRTVAGARASLSTTTTTGEFEIRITWD